MPTVVFNDETYEGEVGETLVSVGRRNEAHVGYLCGGIGVCQTCVCKITSGEEHLSPVNDVERRFIRKVWLDDGYRMSCQTSLRGPGPVEVLSRAEQIRREAMAIFTPPEDTTPWENMGVLANHIGRIFANQLVLFPANAAGVVNQVVKNPPSIKRIQGVMSDAVKVSKRMITGSSSAEQAQTE